MTSLKMKPNLSLWSAALLMNLSFPAAAQIDVGQSFPDLALPTLDGETRSISDYRGRKIILHVFASW